MKTLDATFAALSVLAAAGAWAQATPLSYTDVAPYTDVASTGTAGAPWYWKGQLTRAEVQAVMQQARMEGSIASGDAIGYPYLTKTSSSLAQAAPAPSSAQALGGPPADDLTTDGYRFVGGEAGYVYVGHGRPAR